LELRFHYVCPQTYDPTSLGEKKRNRMEVHRLERIRIEGIGLGARGRRTSFKVKS